MHHHPRHRRPRPPPGKLNINTCDSQIFEYLPSIDSALADNIMAERDARRQGFVSFADLRAVPGMNNNRLGGAVRPSRASFKRVRG
jgi:DNA uptake protein ComE-like DNA-binding protein